MKTPRIYFRELMQKQIKQYLSNIGARGGKASAKKLTAKQRKARATNAVRAREAKRAQTSSPTKK
jgi:hypothetical protein